MYTVLKYVSTLENESCVSTAGFDVGFVEPGDVAPIWLFVRRELKWFSTCERENVRLSIKSPGPVNARNPLLTTNTPKSIVQAQDPSSVRERSSVCQVYEIEKQGSKEEEWEHAHKCVCNAQRQNPESKEDQLNAGGSNKIAVVILSVTDVCVLWNCCCRVSNFP